MSDGYRQLSAAEIRELLRELLDRAAAEGIEIDAYLVGGAAMALQLGREQLTPDVDGLFRPFEAVVRIGRAMAEEHGLSPTWVNENARPFIVFDIADEAHFVEVPIGSHTIRVASPRALLAMKMARYARKDYPDITALITSLGLTTADEIADLTIDVLGEDSPTISEGRDDLVLRAAEALRRVNLS
ncbi:hypothetical protein [Microcella pacifica]|uniref:Uncharacterized protein n=1 Tax=Microcella pacifica TaxID=2591847 RepID=A0A9E5JMR9_9MICO|nr:hypothetical protein [Microcella pacifica]NHF62385.1 hypothetical protein [Microcella pacifica]